MANIIERAFDASKNIVKTIFLGKPNLFTTSDLNRQIEAFKYQMKSIEDRLGAESDMVISFESTGIQTRCMVDSGTYFRVNGLNIPLPNPSDVFGVAATYGQEVYFYVWGNFVRKTYADDPTHEIVGAKFSDGTSMPSADQLILGEVHYTMTDDVKDITKSSNDFAFLIAKMNVLNTYDKYIRLNYKPSGSSVMMDSVTSLEYINQPAQDHEDDPLVIGDNFNVCMNKLISKDSVRKNEIIQLNNRFSPYIENTTWKQNAQGNMPFEYRIHNGFLYIHVPESSSTVYPTRTGGLIFASSTFEGDDARFIAQHFSHMGYGSRADSIEGNILIPIGSCNLTGSVSLEDDDAQPVSGYGEYGIMMQKGPGGIMSLQIGAYISSAIKFDSENKPDIILGPVNLLSVPRATFHINSTSAIIPLME